MNLNKEETKLLGKCGEGFIQKQWTYSGVPQKYCVPGTEPWTGNSERRPRLFHVSQKCGSLGFQ